MMNAGLTIERVVPADIRAIHALEQRCFPAPWRREFFESELTNEGRFNLVARHEGAIAGYLFAMWFADEMHINKIAVDETLRRQGIALRGRIHPQSLLPGWGIGGGDDEGALTAGGWGVGQKQC